MQTTASKWILAGMTALALVSGGFARAQETATPAQPAPLVLADAGEDDDENEGGWFAWMGGDHDGHGDHRGGHRGHDGGRGGDHDDDEDKGEGRGDDDHAGRHGCGPQGAGDDDDDDGAACGPGAQAQPGTPPANGLFQNGQAPKAQVN